jgi:Ca2+/Na+ antiporter
MCACVLLVCTGDIFVENSSAVDWQRLVEVRSYSAGTK